MYLPQITSFTLPTSMAVLNRTLCRAALDTSTNIFTMVAHPRWMVGRKSTVVDAAATPVMFPNKFGSLCTGVYDRLSFNEDFRSAAH